MFTDNKGVAFDLYDIILICAIINPDNACLRECSIVWSKCDIGVTRVDDVDVADLQIFYNV